MPLRRLGPTVVLLLSLAGCGRSATAPTDGGLTIAGTDAILTLQSVRFQALAGTRPVLAQWRSSDSEVATVDADGVVTGHRHGRTTLQAWYGTTVASKTIEIFNDYGGTWIGEAGVGRCDGGAPHDWLPSCDWINSEGLLIHRVAINIAHATDNVKIVSGEYDLSAMGRSYLGHCDFHAPAIPLQGFLMSDGRLLLGGGVMNGRERWTVSEWTAFLTAEPAMRASWTLVVGGETGVITLTLGTVGLTRSEPDHCG